MSGIGSGSSPAISGTSGPQDRYIRENATTCYVPGPDHPDEIHMDIERYELETGLGSCAPGTSDVTIQPAPCAENETELAALWVERVQPDGTYAPPERLTSRDCITPADIAQEAEHALATMTIPTPDATIQARQPLLINVHYPTQATATAITEQVTLLDVPVNIRADPTEYTWNFDDPHSPTNTLTTTNPGTTWQPGNTTPDQTWIGHTYTNIGHPDQHPDTHLDPQGDRYRDNITITLTTTWTGSYQLAGTPTWTTIDGTITTTSTLDPLTVTEARTRLVCDDLHGNTTC